MLKLSNLQLNSGR